MMRQPDHPVTIFGWRQTMLGLTCRLTAFATDTAFKVNHQRQLRHISPPQMANYTLFLPCITMPSHATNKYHRHQQRSLQKTSPQ